ncbi:MAG: hypothetical protein DMF52_13315 [Acidobacteria bacterium]|nr:MAG: hypothetical protein DMF52_13315 [Acidobacteriota bacterium]
MMSAAPAHCTPSSFSPRKIAASRRVPSGSKVLRTDAVCGPTLLSPATNSTRPNTVAERTIPRTLPHSLTPRGTRNPPP